MSSTIKYVFICLHVYIKLDFPITHYPVPTQKGGHSCNWAELSLKPIEGILSLRYSYRLSFSLIKFWTVEIICFYSDRFCFSFVKRFSVLKYNLFKSTKQTKKQSYIRSLIGQYLRLESVTTSNLCLCHIISVCLLHRKYDVCSCLSQSEDINPGVLSVKTKFMKDYERACQEDWPSIPIGLFTSDHS